MLRNKTVKKQTFYGYILAIFLAAVAICSCGEKKTTIEARNSAIYVNDTLKVITSAEVDYARIPREYWEHRLENIRCMGVNTITVKIPWMLHEPQKGVFNFEGMNDVKAFCRIAQEKNLLVWLHIGPYVGAEWDMGGMPWWLLNIEGIRLRSNHKPFMQRVQYYFDALGKELSGSLISNGGNIAFIQIEESQGIEKADKGYLKAVYDCARKAGFNSGLTFTAATKNNFMVTAIDSAFISLDIDSHQKADEHFTGVLKYRYDAPLVCSSLGGDYKTVWGGESASRNWNKVFMRMFEMLEKGTSVSINGMVAGTSFGHTAGATMADGNYKPYATVHNSDGLLKLWGGVDDEFYKKFRRTIFTYAQEDNKKQDEPRPTPNLSSFPEQKVAEVAPLFDNLPEATEAKSPKTMEELGYGYGALLYTTLLPEVAEGTKLLLPGVHDYAQVFINDTPVGHIDRREKRTELNLPKAKEGAKLEILVDATGRVADVKGYKDYKGLTEKVELQTADGNKKELQNWKMYSLPAEYSFAASRNYQKCEKEKRPGYYRTTFKKSGEGDLYLYMGAWGKGEVWLNGKSLGRYWHCGPQYTLYVPGCWLKEGDNELVILDLIGPTEAVVKGIDYSFM